MHFPKHCNTRTQQLSVKFHPTLVLCPFNQTQNLSDLGTEYQMNAIPDYRSYLDTKDEKIPAKDKSKKENNLSCPKGPQLWLPILAFVYL